MRERKRLSFVAASDAQCFAHQQPGHTAIAMFRLHVLGDHRPTRADVTIPRVSSYDTRANWRPMYIGNCYLIPMHLHQHGEGLRDPRFFILNFKLYAFIPCALEVR